MFITRLFGFFLALFDFEKNSKVSVDLKFAAIATSRKTKANGNADKRETLRNKTSTAFLFYFDSVPFCIQSVFRR